MEFNYPEPGVICFGKTPATIEHEGRIWTAIQLEKARSNTIAVFDTAGARTRPIVLDSPGCCYQACLVPRAAGGVRAVWNEIEHGWWKIRTGVVDGASDGFAEVTTLHESERLCTGPTAARWAGALWVAWTGIAGGALRIHVARGDGASWTVGPPVSDENVDAMRPCLVAGADALYLVWDQYRDGGYEVVLSRLDDDKWRTIETLRGEGARWFYPRATAAPDGRVFVTWMVMKEVTDELGIVDHFPFAMAGAWHGEAFEILRDPGNASDDRIVADLREGLLASNGEHYRGYDGVRRNPWISASDGGDVWCMWEMRKESDRRKVPGHLAGRKLNADGTWGDTVVLHSDRYMYSVPQRYTGPAIPVGFLAAENEGLDIVGGAFVDPSDTTPWPVDAARWSRWRPVTIAADERKRASVTADGRAFTLYWADTHCHSVFSPDAEGEVDELIHFARDIAGLDAVGVLDNDYYPHKALTEAEWAIHQELSTHFTREGDFVVFPGWEYTYHRRDLKPDFNHRAILYPRAGGRLYRRIDGDAAVDRDLFGALSGSKAMCYPHHPTWEIIDPALDWNVEVCSSWRVVIEETDFALRMLQAGHKFGFIGSSDSHRAVPGLGGALTGVYADALTPEALFDAYRNRRIFATQGTRMVIEFSAGGAFMGGVTEVEGDVPIRVRVAAPLEIERLNVLCDGVTVYDQEGGGEEVEFEWLDDRGGPGEHFYFLRVKLVGDPSFNTDPAENYLPPFKCAGNYPHNHARARGPFGWSSPVWVTVR